MDALVNLVRSRCPAFTERALTFEDFLAVCAAEQIIVELKRHPLDEQLIRKPLAKIVLNAGLSERYRTFAGFHALAHWLGHPAPQQFYLGSPGWLDTIEIEASTIGFLAVSPHAAGPPYPRLTRARMSEEQIEFWIEHPRTPHERMVREANRRRQRSPSTRTAIARRAQMELPWPAQQLGLWCRQEDR